MKLSEFDHGKAKNLPIQTIDDEGDEDEADFEKVIVKKKTPKKFYLRPT